MSRPRLWAEDEVLGAAMDLFRAKGFEAVSLREIERATGLHSGSLYQAYQSKEGVFTAALEAYRNRVVAARIERHIEAAADPVAGLVDFFASTYEDRPQRDPGCLVTNSAVEAPLRAAAARDAVAASLELIRDAFAAALRRRGLQAGAARSGAAALLALYQGLLVLVRFGTPERELEDVIAAVRTIATAGEGR